MPPMPPQEPEPSKAQVSPLQLGETKTAGPPTGRTRDDSPSR